MRPIFVSLSIVFLLSSCAVSNVESYKAATELNIESMYVISAAHEFKNARIQESEFCEAVIEKGIKCQVANKDRIPGTQVNVERLMQNVVNGNFSHVVMIGLTRTTAEDSLIANTQVNQNGYTRTNFIQSTTNNNLHSIQVISTDEGVVVYSAEIESEYGDTSLEWESRFYYGQVFDPVIKELFPE